MHPETGLIDFDKLRETALVFRPQMILCGASAYPRVVDFKKFREIADEVRGSRVVCACMPEFGADYLFTNQMVSRGGVKRCRQWRPHLDDPSSDRSLVDPIP